MTRVTKFRKKSGKALAETAGAAVGQGASLDQRRDGNQEQALGRLEKARAAELMGALLGWANLFSDLLSVRCNMYRWYT